jgi:hypothetical protein
MRHVFFVQREIFMAKATKDGKNWTTMDGSSYQCWGFRDSRRLSISRCDCDQKAEVIVLVSYLRSWGRQETVVPRSQWLYYIQHCI